MSSSTDRSAEITEKVTKWLSEERQLFEPRDDPSAILNIVVRLGTVSINIAIQKEHRDRVNILSSIGPPEELLKAYKYLKPGARKQFVFEISMALYNNNLVYSFEPDILNLQRIKIAESIYYDGLTKDRFFATITRVSKTLAMMNMHYSRLADVKVDN